MSWSDSGAQTPTEGRHPRETPASLFPKAGCKSHLFFSHLQPTVPCPPGHHSVDSRIFFLGLRRCLCHLSTLNLSVYPYPVLLSVHLHPVCPPSPCTVCPSSPYAAVCPPSPCLSILLCVAICPSSPCTAVCPPSPGSVCPSFLCVRSGRIRRHTTGQMRDLTG